MPAYKATYFRTAKPPYIYPGHRVTAASRVAARRKVTLIIFSPFFFPRGGEDDDDPRYHTPIITCLSPLRKRPGLQEDRGTKKGPAIHLKRSL